MQTTDTAAFSKLLADVHAFYRQDFSEFAADVWIQAMRPYDLKAVREAFGRHTVNPDSGQFMPKPADIVKMLGGTSQDAGLVAWSKVDRAIRSCGTYRSVVFDDPIIHRVVVEMGGWVQLGTKNEDEWPFVSKEFVNRYRGYKMRSETPEYLPVLIGIAEAQNQRLGHQTELPTLIGDARVCERVLKGGSDKALPTFTQLTADRAQALIPKANKRISGEIAA